MGSSCIVFHNTSKFLPRAVSGFHMNQSIHVPVFLPNLHSQPSGKLNFTHLDLVRTLAFLVDKGFFCINSIKSLSKMPRQPVALTDGLGAGLTLHRLHMWTPKDILYLRQDTAVYLFQSVGSFCSLKTVHSSRRRHVPCFMLLQVASPCWRLLVK